MRRDPNERATTVYLSVQMFKALKLLCVHENRTMKEMVAEAVNLLFSKRNMPTLALAFMVMLSGCDGEWLFQKSDELKEAYRYDEMFRDFGPSNPPPVIELRDKSVVLK